MKTIVFIILFSGVFCAYAQVIPADTLKVVVETSFGELTFTRICSLNKFEFTQSKHAIFNKDVEAEALEKKIASDTLSVKFSISSEGKITSFKILKKSGIHQLNKFLSGLFKDAISKMRKEPDALNCNNEKAAYILPLVYVRQKLK